MQDSTANAPRSIQHSLNTASTVWCRHGDGDSRAGPRPFGHALSDPTRARLQLALREAPGYPAELADLIGVTRQNLSNHLACLRGCGLVVAVPEGRRTRYELTDTRIRHALDDLLGLVLAVDPAACPDAADKDCC
jgi:DNA-binding transcriptional ArsR family regulator